MLQRQRPCEAPADSPPSNALTTTAVTTLTATATTTATSSGSQLSSMAFRDRSADSSPAPRSSSRGSELADMISFGADGSPIGSAGVIGSPSTSGVFSGSDVSAGGTAASDNLVVTLALTQMNISSETTATDSRGLVAVRSPRLAPRRSQHLQPPVAYPMVRKCMSDTNAMDDSPSMEVDVVELSRSGGSATIVGGVGGVGERTHSCPERDPSIEYATSTTGAQPATASSLRRQHGCHALKSFKSKRYWEQKYADDMQDDDDLETEASDKKRLRERLSASGIDDNGGADDSAIGHGGGGSNDVGSHIGNGHAFDGKPSLVKQGRVYESLAASTVDASSPRRRLEKQDPLSGVGMSTELLQQGHETSAPQRCPVVQEDPLGLPSQTFVNQPGLVPGQQQSPLRLSPNTLQHNSQLWLDPQLIHQSQVLHNAPTSVNNITAQPLLNFLTQQVQQQQHYHQHHRHHQQQQFEQAAEQLQARQQLLALVEQLHNAQSNAILSPTGSLLIPPLPTVERGSVDALISPLERAKVATSLASLPDAIGGSSPVARARSSPPSASPPSANSPLVGQSMRTSLTPPSYSLRLDSGSCVNKEWPRHRSGSDAAMSSAAPAHSLSPSSSVGLSCSLCQQHFPDEFVLQVHQLTWHTDAVAKLQQACQQHDQLERLVGPSSGDGEVGRTAVTTNDCEHCGRCFDEPSQLLEHVKRHLDENPSLVDGGRLMSPTAPSDESLLESNRSPTVMTPTSASSCSSGGQANSSSGGKMYKCHFCSKNFTRSDMLARHERTHTGQRPYRCPVCHQEFGRTDHLMTHMRTHSGEKPYSCPHCAYKACRRDMITRHMKVHQKPGRQKNVPVRPLRRSEEVVESLEPPQIGRSAAPVFGAPLIRTQLLAPAADHRTHPQLAHTLSAPGPQLAAAPVRLKHECASASLDSANHLFAMHGARLATLGQVPATGFPFDNDVFQTTGIGSTTAASTTTVGGGAASETAIGPTSATGCLDGETVGRARTIGAGDLPRVQITLCSNSSSHSGSASPETVRAAAVTSAPTSLATETVLPTGADALTAAAAQMDQTAGQTLLGIAQGKTNAASSAGLVGVASSAADKPPHLSIGPLQAFNWQQVLQLNHLAVRRMSSTDSGFSAMSGGGSGGWRTSGLSLSSQDSGDSGLPFSPGPFPLSATYFSPVGVGGRTHAASASCVPGTRSTLSSMDSSIDSDIFTGPIRLARIPMSSLAERVSDTHEVAVAAAAAAAAPDGAMARRRPAGLDVDDSSGGSGAASALDAGHDQHRPAMTTASAPSSLAHSFSMGGGPGPAPTSPVKHPPLQHQRALAGSGMLLSSDLSTVNEHETAGRAEQTVVKQEPVG